MILLRGAFLSLERIQLLLLRNQFQFNRDILSYYYFFQFFIITFYIIIRNYDFTINIHFLITSLLVCYHCY